MYALFMTIIKAFDTANNHELLFTLLLCFGASEGLIHIIRYLHTYFKLKSTCLESLEAIINYTGGV
jgi:hypothetical protein